MKIHSDGIYSTACPRNCYSTCSLQIHLENGRIRRIEPHPDNLATGRGVCLKGLSYIERVYSPERILQPLKRRAGTHDFMPISWPEALDTIAAELVRIRDVWGAQSLLYYTGSGTKGLLNSVGMEFWRLYGGCTTTYGDLCWPAGLEATRLTLGDNKHNAPWDLENAQLIILWGKNAAETNVQQMLHIDHAREKGAMLIVIDPRRTDSAERADLLVQPRPGSDGALALGIARVLINKGWIDNNFISRHVYGFKEFSEHVQAYTPEKTARISDVPAAIVERLAAAIHEHPPLSICAGFGMQRYTNSGQAFRAIIALLAITGQIAKPGAGWIYANLQSHIFSTVRDPLDSFPPQVPDGVVRVGISTALLGPRMLELNDPPLKMAWVERGNPISQNPGTGKVLEAFRSLDFRVVIEQFLTDTAREADIILPAKSFFEQSDIIGAYWHPYIQLKQKIIEPPGQVKPESEVYWLLAKRLGLSVQQLSGKIPGPDDSAVEAFLESKLAPFPELTLERLQRGPVLAPGVEEVAFADFCFPTPSGKIELYSAEARDRWRLDPLPAFTEAEESLAGPSAAAQRYFLNLLTPNTKNHIHSQFNNLPSIRQFSPKPVLTIGTADAASRGIANGDPVRLFNDRGELFLEARIDFGLKKGCVCLANGWWISQGGGVNFLSMARETDMGYGAAFHDNLVEVEKVKS